MKLSNEILTAAIGDEVHDSLAINLYWNEITYFVGFQRVEKRVNKYELAIKLYKLLKSGGVKPDIDIAAEDIGLFFEVAEKLFSEIEKEK